MMDGWIYGWTETDRQTDRQTDTERIFAISGVLSRVRLSLD